MILIDNIYYIFCCLYRANKESRIEDSWRVGGGSVTAIYLCLSLFFYLAPLVDYIFSPGYSKYLICVVACITGAIITIRYSKYLPFDKLEEKIKNMDRHKRKNLNIFTYLFLFTCLPVSAVCAYYFK